MGIICVHATVACVPELCLQRGVIATTRRPRVVSLIVLFDSHMAYAKRNRRVEEDGQATRHCGVATGPQWSPPPPHIFLTSGHAFLLQDGQPVPPNLVRSAAFP